MGVTYCRQIGGFVVLTDRDCVWLGSIACLSNADDQQDSNGIQLPGGRFVLSQMPLEQRVAG
jgi:hypothetical protein